MLVATVQGIRVWKFNPYHGAGGRFTSGPGAAGSAVKAKPGVDPRVTKEVQQALQSVPSGHLSGLKHGVVIEAGRGIRGQGGDYLGGGIKLYRGSDRLNTSFSDNLRHEVGHHVHSQLQKGTNPKVVAAKTAWASAQDKHGGVTSYTRTFTGRKKWAQSSEDFAALYSSRLGVGSLTYRNAPAPLKRAFDQVYSALE